MTDPLVTIGDFSRMTHLTVKALRHYHDAGILVPWNIDESSGYRRYHVDQVPIAQVIRRLRDLDMPLEEVRAVVGAPDVDSRNSAIAEHLARMEVQLKQTRDTVRALRSLLETPRGGGAVEIRAVAAQWVLAIREPVHLSDAAAWARPAYAELYAAVQRSGAERTGVDGCLFSSDVFTKYRGDLMSFIPVSGPIDIGAGPGRVFSHEIPPTELAIMVHDGPGDSIDRTYGELGSFVTREAIGVAGPIWENFLVTAADTEDESEHRTEVGWPIFRTQPASDG